MCFVWISEQTAIISLYNINWLVCITETESVHCAVWIHVEISFFAIFVLQIAHLFLRNCEGRSADTKH